MSLSDAAVVVCAGGGMLGADPRAVCTVLTDVAHALGAEIGATRAVVDAGWFGHDRLIGASGVTISPALYLGLGVAGVPFHEIGRPVHVLSVNTDPAAPLSARADLALRTDAVALLPELAARLRGRAHGGRAPGGRARASRAPGVDLVVPRGTAHERLRALTGVPSGPARPVEPLGAAAAATALIGFLTHHGYLEESPK
ncbi:FAD-binding protein [Cryptosporangium aurantiacum]|uniref:Electron transfer flavoprotein FAD-binding domain-containing protein n=1 Tax=Cryptosporangium aurantiacum TaxID=134849 RepID=A0A1M7RP64_9ACTN|nr:FAD-binding protein [Cryptosporangium aurantiacum]SHN48137.1 Electron transfer flavoprotein FAD-binding domain-containing protein [Cryptosporangium aurantiacum]